MQHFDINLNLLKAALTHSGKHDIRYYLNGVCFDPKKGRIMGTDGHRLFIASVEKSDGEQILIPNELIEMVLKAFKKLETVELQVDGAKLAFVGAGSIIQGNTLDGKFPDVDRIIPKKLSGERAQINASYLHSAHNALKIATDAGSKACFPVFHNGNAPAVMVATQSDNKPALSIIMPFACTDTPEHAETLLGLV